MSSDDRFASLDVTRIIQRPLSAIATRAKRNITTGLFGLA